MKMTCFEKKNLVKLGASEKIKNAHFYSLFSLISYMLSISGCYSMFLILRDIMILHFSFTVIYVLVFAFSEGGEERRL